jgi:hypothetical protein
MRKQAITYRVYNVAPDAPSNTGIVTGDLN